MTRSEEVAWAAGLFEGEGCFYVTSHNGKRRRYDYPCAALKMTDEDVVRRFHQVVRFGRVLPKNPGSWGRKNTWEWKCHGFKLTKKLFELIGRHLCKRRFERGYEVLCTEQAPTPQKLGHGTVAGYQRGCRCRSCRAAQRRKVAAWRSSRMGG